MNVNVSLRECARVHMDHVHERTMVIEEGTTSPPRLDKLNVVVATRLPLLQKEAHRPL